MIVSLNPCLNADEYLLPGSRPLSAEELKLISGASAVLLPQGCSEELYRACFSAGPALFPEYGPRFACRGKVGQSLLFEHHGLAQPGTFRWRSPEEFARACRSGPVHNPPFIVKRNSEHEGHGVFFVRDSPSLDEAMRAVEYDSGQGFITQDFIPPGGTVLRVVIIGEKTVSYWKRSPDEGEIITTISRNAVIDHNWRPDLKESGVRLCGKLSSSTGINLAGVDVIFPLHEPAPEPLLLEINYFFGRKGLGGSENYYRLLLEATRDWVLKQGLDPGRVRPV